MDRDLSVNLNHLSCVHDASRIPMYTQVLFKLFLKIMIFSIEKEQKYGQTSKNHEEMYIDVHWICNPGISAGFLRNLRRSIQMMAYRRHHKECFNMQAHMGECKWRWPSLVRRRTANPMSLCDPRVRIPLSTPLLFHIASFHSDTADTLHPCFSHSSPFLYIIIE